MRFMQLPPCKPGYWYVNVAPLGELPVWEQQVMPVNNGKLFGYEERDLLRKQYK